MEQRVNVLSPTQLALTLTLHSSEDDSRQQKPLSRYLFLASGPCHEVIPEATNAEPRAHDISFDFMTCIPHELDDVIEELKKMSVRSVWLVAHGQDLSEDKTFERLESSAIKIKMLNSALEERKGTQKPAQASHERQRLARRLGELIYNGK